MSEGNINTLEAAELSYQFEIADVAGIQPKNKVDYVTKTLEVDIPSNLEFLESDRDPLTGTAASAFRDKETGEVIVAYTGTNPNEGADFWQDVTADIAGIGLGSGYHYGKAYNFYENIADKYGAENITVTGHSLGGNIAQRVALRYNVQNTVVYNSAPLYIPNADKGVGAVVGVGAGIGTWLSSSLNIHSITNDQEKFTGRVTRITTEQDFLNPPSDFAGGIYLGNEFILKNSGNHGLSGIKDSENQKAQIKEILTSPYLEVAAAKAIIDSPGQVKANMAEVEKKLSEFKTNDNKGVLADTNGLTGAEKIYIDYEQASVISSGLSTVALSAVTMVEGKTTAAVGKAEDIMANLDAPAGTLLTADEIKAAYAEAGVEQSTIVDHVQKHCDKKKKQFTELAESFTGVQNRIQTGLQEMVQTDADLAGLISG